MKRVILMLLLLLTCAVFSQKMVTRSGEIKFDATVPGALEEVIGTNKTVSGVFDKATGDIVVQAMVKSFKFKAPLMEDAGMSVRFSNSMVPFLYRATSSLTGLLSASSSPNPSLKIKKLSGCRMSLYSVKFDSSFFNSTHSSLVFSAFKEGLKFR